MKILVFISAVCLHLSGSYGSDDTDGVGAFAYQDSTGNREGSFFIPPFFRPRPFRRPQKPSLKRFPFGGDYTRGGAFPGFQGNPVFPGGQFPAFPKFTDFHMSNFGNADTAYAGAFVGDGVSHQIADINPANPHNPNINVKSKISNNYPSSYKSVYSSSSVSSSNINGKATSSRSAETIVNNDGVETRYKVVS